VNNPLLVRRGETQGDLSGDLDRLTLRQGPRGEPLSQRLPVEQLHDGVHLAVGVTKLVDREDVRVREGRDGFRLALETRERGRIGRNGLGEDLDRHLAAQARVPRPVDFPHPAPLAPTSLFARS